MQNLFMRTSLFNIGSNSSFKKGGNRVLRCAGREINGTPAREINGTPAVSAPFGNSQPRYNYSIEDLKYLCDALEKRIRKYGPWIIHPFHAFFGLYEYSLRCPRHYLSFFFRETENGNDCPCGDNPCNENGNDCPCGDNPCNENGNDCPCGDNPCNENGNDCPCNENGNDCPCNENGNDCPCNENGNDCPCGDNPCNGNQKKKSNKNGNDCHCGDNPCNGNQKKKSYAHLWVQCERCFALNYRSHFLEKLYVCESCKSHLKMSSSDRIEISINPDTWDPMDEDMVSTDPIEFHSVSTDPIEFHSEEDSYEESYKDRIDSYRRETGLNEAIQTGVCQVNRTPLAMGVMDFFFMGGSMGSVVGEKITRLVEYANSKTLPLIILCASGGARMQEGSFSLMQMAKISGALYDFQLARKLFYLAILTSPTTGGVTASFGMLGDVIIAEPNAYIAFAGKRVIEETLKIEVPEGSQEAEYLFEKGLFDGIVSRPESRHFMDLVFYFHTLFLDLE
uniref:acetyl-CoA carboxylase carboxyltransferase beta subunit n=1 Tax=Dicranostigma leptopodum TaxID=56851 RepID=UPI0021153C85|nr:acetyl-CoA carboxylase carboxyltransferase beta subunit [Dicranostigma leptopodum]USN94270.1 acetyl-CoA carboxylase carboxyltransferase beta subunit [Dicranostigma leptopodum]